MSSVVWLLLVGTTRLVLAYWSDNSENASILRMCLRFSTFLKLPIRLSASHCARNFWQWFTPSRYRIPRAFLSRRKDGLFPHAYLERPCEILYRFQAGSGLVQILWQQNQWFRLAGNVARYQGELFRTQNNLFLYYLRTIWFKSVDHNIPFIPNIDSRYLPNM